jgi:iron(III) transport system permease protein
VRWLPSWVTDRADDLSSVFSRRVDTDRPVKWAVLSAIVVTVVVLILLPLGFMLWTSLWSGYPGQFSGSVTVDHFVSVYLAGNYDVLGLFTNSLVVAAGKTVVAMAFGLLLAWLFVRTDLPTKGAMELVIVSPYAIPGYLYALMYIITYGPEHGIVSTYLMRTFGLSRGPFDLFSPWGIVAVVGLDAVTSFYLLTVPALQDMNPSFEEAARVHGANLFRTVRSISFPLILPAILSATLVTFIHGLGEFTVVQILGTRAGFDVYATAIWSAVRVDIPPDYGGAAALACSLLLVTTVLVVYYRKLTARKEDFMTVTGRGYHPGTWSLGRWRWPVAIALWAVLFVVWILPILVMVLVSLHATWQGRIDPTALTLQHYVTAVETPTIRTAVTNSLLVSLGAASLGTVLVVGTAYYTERTSARFRGLIDGLSLTPLAVPGIIMGGSILFASLWLGKLPFLDLYGTLWIILIGSVVVYFPISSRIAVGNVVQIHSELEEAAHVYGASWVEQLREVFLPLFRNTVAVIWFYLLIHVFQLITIAIMTYTSETTVLPVELFFMYTREASYGLVAAISTIFIAVTMGLLLLMRRFGITFYEMTSR